MAQKISLSYLMLPLMFLGNACGTSGYENPGTQVAAPASTTPTPSTTNNNPTTTVTQGGGIVTDTNATGALSLAIDGNAFGSNTGRGVFALLMDANHTIIGNSNTVVNETGAFVLSFANKVTRGQSYSVAYFVDRNGNGICNIGNANSTADANADAGYVLNVNDITANTNVKVVSDPNLVTTVCDYFGQYNFNIVGSGFTPHNGETVYVALMDKQDNTFVAGPMGQVIINGAFAMAWQSVMLPGHNYQASYFIDQTRTQTCENHSWIYTTPAPVSGNITANVNHDQTQTPVCDNFPLVSE